MAKETHPQTREGQQELLEVWGFDLLAHVEAMLRHARQYNQEVKQLHSHLGKGQTTDQVPLDAVLQHVKEPTVFNIVQSNSRRDCGGSGTGKDRAKKAGSITPRLLDDVVRTQSRYPSRVLSALYESNAE